MTTTKVALAALLLLLAGTATAQGENKMKAQLMIFGKTHALNHVTVWRTPETERAIELVEVYLTASPLPFKAPPKPEETAKAPIRG